MTNHALADTVTMLRRSLRRMRRYPSLTLFIAGIPVVLMLLFVYVFGGTLGAGIGGVATAGSAGGAAASVLDRDAYLAYVVPGILLIGVAGAGQGTAISVAMDMTTGIIARFRTMAIARSSVLAGHILGSVVQTLLATAIVVLVALAIGFRPSPGPADWLGAMGLLVLAAIAVSALCVALGLAANSVETASNSPMFLTLLPFLGSGFVPASSMPGPLRWFAENQPFTPLNEALRSFLLGTPMGNSAVLAIAWCIGLAVLGLVWARRLYERLPVRAGA
jgi:ABC-2 type transport system permease protein